MESKSSNERFFEEPIGSQEMRWFTVEQIAATNLSEKGISHHISSNHVREVWMIIWIFIFDLDSSNVNKCRQTVVLFKETQKANVVQVIVNGKDDYG